MNTFFMTLLVGVSLSMDAFSLSLAYGTQGLNNKNKLILSIIVGLYHFFMPLLGLTAGGIITRYLVIDINLLVSIIFLIIGIEMIYSGIKKKEEKVLVSIPGFLLFGLTVSIDSFTTGIGLKAINDNYLQVASIFAGTSFLFTYIGLKLGNKISDLLGYVAPIIGGVVLVILAINYYSV